MGNFVNPGNGEFAMSRNSKLYVDKSGLIQLTNDILGTEDRRIVVCRPRRFGKTMALSMLEAYYSCGCDSRELFRGLAIENSPDYETHLNKHNVISFDVQGLYLSAARAKRLSDFSKYISERINADLAAIYPEQVQGNEKSLSRSLQAIHAAHGANFVFLLDEWDVIYREERFNESLKKDFTDFLRSIFKNGQVSGCIDLVYMTGILPVPDAAAQLGLNNFWEYTMLRPDIFAEYTGFTEEEVFSLCERCQMPVADMKNWYEGYQAGEVGPVYCPASVVQALIRREVRGYWNKTGSSAELAGFVNSVKPGFQEKVKGLLAGVSVGVCPDNGGIDLSHLEWLDTALTALVHLGYLTYHNGQVRIPNWEVAKGFLQVLSRAEHNPASKIMARSAELWHKTADGDADAVARILEENHGTFSSDLTYSQETDLACIIAASYKWLAELSYTFHRELPEGKGFADFAFLPGDPGCIPVIVELKWDVSADTAIRQIKERRYTGKVHGSPSVLLVGISYEKDSEKPNYKKHSCIIEQADNP